MSDLLVAGSLATGDHVAGVSDLDLVAIVEGRVDEAREAALVALHRELDRGPAAGADLGCVYVDEGTLSVADALHPTWTHGKLVQRTLSGINRAELVRHGFAVRGRPPTSLLPPMTDDDRAGARTRLADRPAHRPPTGKVVSPRVRTGWIAWRDARRTISAARRSSMCT